MFEFILFHGGCHGCTQQIIHENYKFCMRCKFFDYDDSKNLPDLNNQPLSKADMIRLELQLQEDSD